VRVFAARKTEPDEPFAEELPHSIFQQGHSPSIVLNQHVVSGKDVCDAGLKWYRWLWNAQPSKLAARKSRSPNLLGDREHRCSTNVDWKK